MSKNIIILVIIVAIVASIIAIVVYNTETYTVESDCNVNSQNQVIKDTILTESETSVIESEENSFSISEVNNHNSKYDCWMAIDGKVYDVTSYIASGEHKRGIANGCCGIDATVMFQMEKKHSSPKALKLLDQLFIGELQ